MLSVISSSSWATVSCTFAAGSTQTEAVPLNPAAISAGADIPVGTILYQGTWVMKMIPMPCTWAQSDVGKSFWYNSSTVITNTPFPLSGLTTGPFAGAVYQTNIPGIGVVISRDSNGSPVTTTRMIAADVEKVIKQVTTELGGRYDFAGSIRYISLIKTGPITPGNYTFSGANIPSIRSSIEPAAYGHTGSATVTGFPFTFYNVSFQGNLTVSTQTCMTPDVSVAMGTYNLNEDFSGLNTTTPWVDASIALTNCPRFYGFYNNTNTTLLMDYGTGTSNVTTSLNNTIGVRLTPITTVTDSGNGIMALDSTLSGAASGVGIQLGWGESSQTPTLFNFASEYPMTLPKDGSPTLRIPLAARYIQTAANPTPGHANGKVVFLINYY
ncbi:fimbrial protein [Serratia sp. D1N4]